MSSGTTATAIVYGEVANVDTLQEVMRKKNRHKKDAFRKRNIPITPAPRTTLHPTDDSLELIEVHMQEGYTGGHVISSARADISCDALGIVGLLHELNSIMGTSFSIEGTAGLSELLGSYIGRGYDLGTVYARLRPEWFVTRDFSKLQTRQDKLKAMDRQERQDAFDRTTNQIVTPRLKPRRIWDLFSNRVVPTWVARDEFWAISHSWMAETSRMKVLTSINAYEWPVPIPNDSSLERVRIELLNLGAKYVWLDVLCLRQEGSAEKEALRLEEWKIDVPTIGYVYHQNQMVVQYFCGLGRPFRTTDLVKFESERHWLNRAWTLQEISSNSITAGIADHSPAAPEAVTDDRGWHYAEADLGRFFDQLGYMQTFAQELDSIFPVLSAMRERFATSELDKVAGLAYLLRPNVLPAYIRGQHPEEAWSNLLKAIAPRYRGDLLFLCRASKSEKQKWAPSWHQVMKEPLPSVGGIFLFEEVSYLKDESAFSHVGYRFDKCQVQGLASQEGVEGSKARKGRVIIDISHEFEVISQYPNSIPEGDYTMVGSQGLDHWVVARIGAKGHLEKISVLRIPLLSEVDRMRSLTRESSCRRSSTYV